MEKTHKITTVEMLLDFINRINRGRIVDTYLESNKADLKQY